MTNERARLEKLLSLKILDTAPEKRYDDIVKIASEICRAPVALVSLVDDSRQWFKACVGLDVKQTSRDIAFCDYTIQARKPMVIPDALKDERFVNNPLVTGAPFIRFYAGVPLWTRDGHCIGSLCVIDMVPREMSEAQISAMEALSRLLMIEIESRSLASEREMDRVQLKHAQERLFEATRYMTAGVYTLSKDGKCTWCNEAYLQITGLTKEQSIGYGYMQSVLEEDRIDLMTLSQERRSRGEELRATSRLRWPDGRIRQVVIHSRTTPSGDRVGCVFDITDIDLHAQAPVLKKAE